MSALPFSQACENNKSFILEVLRDAFADRITVLEIGAGTGQHLLSADARWALVATRLHLAQAQPPSAATSSCSCVLKVTASGPHAVRSSFPARTESLAFAGHF